MARPRPARAEEPAPAVPAKYRALFMTTMEADLAEMEQALDTGDQRLLGKSLHRMRGALSVMKMTALTERLEALEAALRSDGLDAAARLEGEALAGSLRGMLAEI
ncbi:Hpt domain protein [compost metagenome]